MWVRPKTDPSMYREDRSDELINIDAYRIIRIEGNARSEPDGAGGTRAIDSEQDGVGGSRTTDGEQDHDGRVVYDSWSVRAYPIRSPGQSGLLPSTGAVELARTSTHEHAQQVVQYLLDAMQRGAGAVDLTEIPTSPPSAENPRKVSATRGKQ